MIDNTTETMRVHAKGHQRKAWLWIVLVVTGATLNGWAYQDRISWLTTVGIALTSWAASQFGKAIAQRDAALSALHHLERHETEA